MKILFKTIAMFLILGLAACESSEEISKGLDHQLPECKALTLTANGQTKVIEDVLLTKLLWGFIPQNNLETVVLPTITLTKGSNVSITMQLSDNAGLKSVDLSYGTWLFSKYINFANPEGDIPLNPKSYEFTAELTVPNEAVTTPWIDDFYFNDGSLMKITQPYHKLVLTIIDVNLNTRIVPVYVKVE